MPVSDLSFCPHVRLVLFLLKWRFSHTCLLLGGVGLVVSAKRSYTVLIVRDTVSIILNGKKIRVSYVSPGFRYLRMIDSCTVGESAGDSTSSNYMRKYCLGLWCNCILHMCVCVCVCVKESVYAAFTWTWMWCQQQIRVDKAWLSPSFPLIVCFEHSSSMQMHNP